MNKIKIGSLPGSDGGGVLSPELLAPAGDWECARAAVENGADAIYFGLERFNARMRAHNFTQADLPNLMEFLHRRGVRGYVTFNTLVFANELAEATDYLRSIIAAGVDAAIVQDIGICRLIRRLSPDFPIHASTQMTITSAAGVEFARNLGCQLVVLARECSIKEIGALRAQESGNRVQNAEIGGSNTAIKLPDSLPLEVFVHGALCVAYSGQCLTSESLGGRSANRGECAQACRMPYELISDGQLVPLGDRKYLLSPQDLAGLEVLPELIRAGVASFKIEGRLKSPEYVANITRIYRRAIDRVLDESLVKESGGAIRSELPSPGLRPPSPRLTGRGWGEGLSLVTDGNDQAIATRSVISTQAEIGTWKADLAVPAPGADDRYDMEMAFSRGLHTGWFGGINNQELVHARFGKKRGVLLGTVTEVGRDSVMLTLIAPLKAGDGVVFDAGRPEDREEGGRIYAVRPGRLAVSAAPKSSTERGSAPASRVSITFGPDAVDFNRVHVGDQVWKTSDPELDRRLRLTFSQEQPQFQRPIRIEVNGCLGRPLTVIASDNDGNVAQAASQMPLSEARKQPLTTERLQEQLGRLGGTAFCPGELVNKVEGKLMLPMSELNRLRREVVAELDRLRTQPKRWALSSSDGVTPWMITNRGVAGSDMRDSEAAAELVVLVRNLSQLEAALGAGAETLYCEFEDPKRYREAVSMVRCSTGCETGARSIFVAPPRIFKMGEDWILKQVRSADADGYLVRNYDHLNFFKDCHCVGDYTLNVANALTAEYFKTRFPLEHLTASYDLNNVQLEALLRSAPPEWFEITIHQHIPMFHMEHCVFCAFLSKGTDYTNCGRPCDTHEVRLRDRVGAEHPLKADAGCRNTVFNSLAQTGAESVDRMMALGARRFRIELLNETPDQVVRTMGMYRQLLRREITGHQLWQELKLVNQLGVTRGQMERS